jgi:hypothetical protein
VGCEWDMYPLTVPWQRGECTVSKLLVKCAI